MEEVCYENVLKQIRNGHQVNTPRCLIHVCVYLYAQDAQVYTDGAVPLVCTVCVCVCVCGMVCGGGSVMVCGGGSVMVCGGGSVMVCGGGSVMVCGRVMVC